MIGFTPKARICAMLGLLALSSAIVFSQAVTGSILGRVTDSTGAVLPGAQISISNPETGTTTRIAATDAQGLYSVPDLGPGTYEMRVSAPGFVTQLWTGIGVAIGSQRVLNITMLPGGPETVVRNAAPAAPISQSSACCGGNVDSSTVRSTPLNGRDWTQLATLQAGVTGVQTGSAQGGGNTERGFGAAMTKTIFAWTVSASTITPTGRPAAFSATAWA